MRVTSVRRAVALLGAAALLVAACGGDNGGDDQAAAGGEDETQELHHLQVGIVPVVDVVPLYLGIEKGFFEEEGLDVEPYVAQGGAAIIPAVVSGEQAIGFSNIVSLLLAEENDLPVQVIAQGIQATDDPE